MSRATAAAAVPVLLFQLVEAAWGLVEVMLVVLVCGHRGRVSQAVAAAALIAVSTCT